MSDAAADAPEVVVVGAGVAGLAAARELAGAGIRVVVLEARDRIGGRIFTHRADGLAVPIELGAEFVHGAPAPLLDLVDEAGLRLVEGAEAHLVRGADGRLGSRPSFGAATDAAGHDAGGGGADRAGDRSATEALRETLGPDGGDPEDPWSPIAGALGYVAGYHGAPPEALSAVALARAEAVASGDAVAHRLVDGYDAVPAWLARRPGGGEPLDLRLGHVVRHVRWHPGGVAVTGEAGGAEFAVPARAAVLTLPIGVLQARPGVPGAVAFDPPLPPSHRAALDGLAMGQALRLVVQCRRPFWTEPGALPAMRDGSGAELAFVHAPDLPIPVWWTQRPVRAPLLVGWCGGPAARALEARLAAGGRGTARALAVGVLAPLFGSTGAAVDAEIVDVHVHRWGDDPFARGAYSYARVGAADAGAALARPVDDTLFLAGEGTVSDGHVATVHGAMSSGRQAARALCRALRGDVVGGGAPAR